MGKIIAVAAHKGGQTKTTSVYALSQAFQKKGKKVLAIDLDTQANLTKVFTGKRGNDIENTLPDAIRSNKPLPIVRICDLDLVPSDVTIASVSSETKKLLAVHLRKMLAPVSAKYDIILLDCPPLITSEETLDILNISDQVLLPLTTDDFSVDGVDTMLECTAEIPNLKVLGIMITMYRRNGGNIYKAFDELIRERYGDLVLKTNIRESSKMKEKISFGNRLFPATTYSFLFPQFQFDYNAACITEVDYWKVADELLERMKKL